MKPRDTSQLTRSRLSTLALMALTALLIYLAARLAQPFIPALSWAVALAIVSWPVHRWMRRRLSRPNLAAFVSVALVTVALVLPVVIVSQKAIAQAQESIRWARSPEAKQKWEQLRAQYPRLGRAAEWTRERVASDSQNAGASNPSQVASGLLAGTISGLVQLGIALFALFFLFRDREDFLHYIRALMPVSSEEATKLLRVSHDAIFAALYGHVGVSLIQGFLGGLMFWFLGLPAPLLWSVVMAIASIIPMLGTFVIWIPAGIYLALSGHVVKAIILFAWGSLAVGMIDNVLYPILVGKRLRLHTLPVFISVIGGLKLFGAAGIVVGPLILALLLAVIEVWKDRTAHGAGAEERLEAA